MSDHAKAEGKQLPMERIARHGHPLLRAMLPDSSRHPDAPIEANKDERRTGNRIRTVYRVARVTRGQAVGLWRVRNISDSGMMLRTRIPLDHGERLSIALSDSLSMEGRVMWSRNGHCGVAFDQPIDSAGVLKTLAAEQGEPTYRPPRLPADMRGRRLLRARHSVGARHRRVAARGRIRP